MRLKVQFQLVSRSRISADIQSFPHIPHTGTNLTLKLVYYRSWGSQLGIWTRPRARGLRIAHQLFPS